MNDREWDAMKQFVKIHFSADLQTYHREWIEAIAKEPPVTLVPVPLKFRRI